MTVNTRLRRRAGLAFTFCVLVLSVAYIIVTFTWREIVETLGDADLPLLLVGGYGSIILVWFARTVRWQILLRMLGVYPRFRDLYLCNALALGAAMVTPAQAGELLKIRLLQRYVPIALTGSLATFGIERVFDLLVIVALTLAALVQPRGILADWTSLYVLGVTIILAVVMLQVAIRWKWLPGVLGQLAAALRTCSGQPVRQMELLGVTIFCWCVTALGWWTSLLSVGVRIDFIDAIALVCLVTVVNVLSFVPGGVGVSEIGVMAFLVRLDVPVAQAQAGAIIIRVYGLLFLTLSLAHFVASRLWSLHPDS